MRTASPTGRLFLPREPIAHRFALDERHHVEQEAVRDARIEERQDVRMLQIRRRLDLGEKALGADHGGQLGAQDLHRDLAIVLEVVREIDGRHTARTEFTLDAVTICKCGSERPGHWFTPSTARFICATQFGITRR